MLLGKGNFLPEGMLSVSNHGLLQMKSTEMAGMYRGEGDVQLN
jgi:hypothetical protein